MPTSAGRPPRAAPLPLADIVVPEGNAGVPVRRLPFPLARRFSNICQAAAAEALEGEDLTPMEYGALAWAADDPGLDQNGLAVRMGIDRTTAGMLVASLEAKGLLERLVNPADRRARALRPTREGERVRRRIRPRAIERQARVLDVLAPEERELLLDFLVRIVTANEQYARPGAARRKPTRRPPP